MAKTPGTSRGKARKGKRPPGTDLSAGAAAPKPAAEAASGKAASGAEAGTAKARKPARTEKASTKTSAKTQAGTAPKLAAKSGGKPAGKPAKRVGEAGSDIAAMPVVIQATPAEVAVTLPEAAVPTKTRPKKTGLKKTGKKPGKQASARRPPRQTFLVAATLADEGTARLSVYAAVTRTPAEALAAVRDLVGPEVAVGLTGKLLGRMAKALGLKPGEVRRI